MNKSSWQIVCVVWLSVMVSVSVSATVVNTAGHLVSPDSDLETSAWMRALFGLALDDASRRCFDQQKVLHRESNQCFQLFHRGPCARREWLVFDKEEAASAGRLEATCRRRQCAPTWGFDVASNKCFRQDTCPSPTAFHYTLFGDGRCLCNATTAVFTSGQGGGSGRCQELFTDDVCPPGKILAPRYSLLEGMDATCTADPCARRSSSETPTTPKTTQEDRPTSTSAAPPLSLRQSQTAIPSRVSEDVIHFGGNRRSPLKDAFGAFSRPSLYFPQTAPSPPLVFQMQRRRFREETFARVAASASQLLSRGSRERPEDPSHQRRPPPTHKSGSGRDSQQEEQEAAATTTKTNRRLNVLLPQHSPPSTTTTDASTTTMVTTTTPPQPDNGGVRLNVKYQDGTTSCHTGVELSTMCALQMKPLFSDLSDVKVPLCVDTWFRFAIGRVGKSEECVTNDDGVCAAKVSVASSEPFDWDFE